MKATQRWCYTEDRSRLVPETHPEAAFLAYIPGDEMPDVAVELLVAGKWVDITEYVADLQVDPEPAGEPKARRPAANKARTKPANK